MDEGWQISDQWIQPHSYLSQQLRQAKVGRGSFSLVGLEQHLTAAAGWRSPFIPRRALGVDSGLWPDWKWPACWRGDGEPEGDNQLSVDQTIMAKCAVGVGSQNSREPCEETSGSLLLLPVPCPDGGICRNLGLGENGLLRGISERLDCAEPRELRARIP